MTTPMNSAPSMMPRRAVLRAGLVVPGALLLAACGATPTAGPTPPPAPTATPGVSVPAIGAATPTVAAARPTTAPTSASPAPATSASTPAPAAPTTAPAATPVAPAATQSPAATVKLNLNTATREQFLTVPGVGDRMVREFLEYRPYRSIQQFRREIGKYVPQEQVTAYERFVFVPVDPNSADVETLQQLPGVDAGLAAQLVAGRPYTNAAAFLTRLGQSVAADQVAVARTYLAIA